MNKQHFTFISTYFFYSLLLLFVILFTLSGYSQVGIDRTNTMTPDASSELDVYSTNKGLLIPRVALTGTGSSSPITPAPATSLLVYNTAAVSDVTPGYYYWNGTSWSRLLAGTSNLSGSGTTNYLARWTPSGNVLGIGVTYDNGTNVGISSASPGAKLDVSGGDIRIATEDRALLLGSTAATQYSLHNHSSNSLWLQNNGNTMSKIVVATAFDWDRQITIQYTPGTTGSTSGDLVIGQIDKNHTNFTHGITRFLTNGLERLRIGSNGNVGIGNTSLSARFHVSGGGQILGTNGTSSNTRTLTILNDGQGQLNFGSYPGAWTSALQIQNNDNTDFVWISPLQDGNNARIRTGGSGLDIYTGGANDAGTFAARFENNGSVGLLNLGVSGNLGSTSDPSNDQGNNWITWGYRSDNNPYYCIRTQYKTYGSYTYSRLQLNWHTGVEIGAASTYGGTRFFNNSPGVGATQIMSIGDGDNHVRVNNYLFAQYLNSTDNAIGSGVTGIMAKAGDNYYRTANAAAVLSFLGVTAPTGDNLGNHTATTYLQMGGQWINFNGGGLYSSGYGNHFWPADANYWHMRSNAGMRVFNNAATSMGYLYHDNSSSFGLLSPNGNWRVRVDNSNTEAYGGFYASTSYIPFIYDRDNNGYYLDANSNSRVANVHTDANLLNWPGYNGLAQAYGHYVWPGRNDGSGASWQQSWYLAGNSSWGLYTNTGLYMAGTSATPFLYDASNTGYYLNMDGTSQLHYVLANNWFRPQGSTGLYWESYGGGFYMEDGTWIRTYNNRSMHINRSGYYAFHPYSPNYTVIYSICGTNAYWNGYFAGSDYSVYAQGYIYATTYGYLSSREHKKDIEKFDQEDYESALAFVDNLDLNYYKYKRDKEFNTTHVGLIAEDTPGNLTTPGKTGVLYGELSIYNTGAIKVLKQRVEDLENKVTKLTDFGSGTISQKTQLIKFSESFKNNLNGVQPMVMVSANETSKELIVKEITSEGFKVENNSGEEIDYNWIAMAEFKANKVHKNEYSPKFTRMIESAEYMVANKEHPRNPAWDEEPELPAGTKQYEDPSAPSIPKNTMVVNHQKPTHEVLSEKDPNIILQGPVPNPDNNVAKRAADDAKKFVPIDESSPLKNDPNLFKEGEPKRD